MQDYAVRLEHTQIECIDALRLIRLRDREDALSYCDPPYFQANMGHYGGYREQDFEDLLKLLATIKGKFLLSSYPSDLLTRYVRENQWQSIEIAGTISAAPEKVRCARQKGRF